MRPPTWDDGKPRFCPFCGDGVRWKRCRYAEVDDEFWEMECENCGRSLSLDPEALLDAGDLDPGLDYGRVEVDST